MIYCGWGLTQISDDWNYLSLISRKFGVNLGWLPTVREINLNALTINATSS